MGRDSDGAEGVTDAHLHAQTMAHLAGADRTLCVHATDSLRRVSDAVFVPQGDLLIPQSSDRPVVPGVPRRDAGVFARAIERVPSAVPMTTTRLSIDMSRRVPMGPTRVDTEVVRDGKRIQAIEARRGR